MGELLQFLLGGANPGQIALCIGIALVLAIVGLVGLVKSWPWLSRAVGVFNAILTLRDDMASIKHELQNNSGTSLKDAVQRTEAAVASLQGQVDGVQDEVGHVKRQAASLKTSIAKTNRRLTDYTDRHP